MEPVGWRNGTWVLVITVGVTAASCTLQGGGQARQPLPATEPAVATTATLQAAYGNLPLSFEANQGQSDAQVQFLARGHGYSLFLTSTEAVLALRNAERMASGSARPKRNAEFKRLPSSVSEQPSASQVHLLSPPALRLRTSDSGLGTGLTPAARGGQPQPSHSGAGGAARQGQLLAGQRPDKVAHQPSHLCQSEIPVDLAQRRAL